MATNRDRSGAGTGSLPDAAPTGVPTGAPVGFLGRVLGGVAGSALVSGLLGAGAALVFIGERLFGAGSGRTTASALGVALVLVALGLRVLRVLGAGGSGGRDHRWIERRALDGMLLLTVAIGCYFLQSDVCSFLFGGKPMAASWPRLATAFQVLWPALALAGALPLLLVEMAYASMARAPHLETGRVRDAFLSGLGLAATLVFAFSLTYVASERDKRVDLSYFRTTRPGEATRKLVRTFDQPVTVTWFFPAGSDVREEVRAYFEDLAKETPNLTVQGLDQAVDPAKAKELGVTGNGLVVLSKSGRREQMSLGLELEQAKSQLKNLDKEVQKRLLQVARPARNIYLTTGHGERTADAASETDKRATIKDLRAGLQELSYTLRDLGLAEGLAADVPQDAGVVMIVGPQKAFLPEEIAALGRFVDRGGRLFIALDPEAGLEYTELLAPLGVVFHAQSLANDQQFARRTNQNSDRVNIATGSYSSSPAVQTLGKLRAPTIYVGAGWLEEAAFKDKPKGVTIDMAVHAMPQTWADLDGNFNFDPPKESRRTFEIAAAITRKAADGKAEDARVFLIADSDVLSDAVLRAVANGYLLVDSVKWLVGDEALAGESSSEVDVPIAHTRNQDVAWFYSAIFLAPALALGVGWFATRSGRRKRARPSARGGARPEAGPGAASGGASAGTTKEVA